MSLGFSSYRAFSEALGVAHSADLSAYTLGSGATERNLIAAADRGTHVRVRLAGKVFGDASGVLALHNAHEVEWLTAHGIDAALVEQAPLHIKTAVIDDRVFFDDRNWCGDDDVMVSDDTAEEVAATAGILDRPGIAPSAELDVALTKGDALLREAQVLKASHDAVALETESLGPSSLTTLLRDVAAHYAVRVLLKRGMSEGSVHTQNVIADLQAHGVQIRTTPANDKFCVTGDQAWVGSANASGGDPRMSDWGATMNDPGGVALLRARFEKAWATAKLPGNDSRPPK